jgi:hypothetical protein
MGSGDCNSGGNATDRATANGDHPLSSASCLKKQADKKRDDRRDQRARGFLGEIDILHDALTVAASAAPR